MSSTVIIGGGALGSALFRELSTRGVQTTLVHRRGGASWHSFSWLNATAPTVPGYYALRMQGILRHLLYSVPRGLAHFDGVLAWDGEHGAQPVQGSNLIETVHEAFTRLADCGHQAELLDAVAAGRLEPALDVEAVSDQPFLWSPDEGWADLPSLIAALRSDGRRAGGVLIEAEAQGVVLDARGRARGVQLSTGELITADTIVVAAGAKTAELLHETGYRMPTELSFGLIVRTEPLAIAAPTRVLRGPEVSIRPEPGNRLALHSGETDPLTEAGLPEASAARSSAETLVARASELLVGHDPLRVQSVDFGIRPLSGDHLPVVGHVPGAPGVYVLQAHSGATVCLALAEFAARELVGGERSSMLDVCDPQRFGRPHAA